MLCGRLRSFRSRKAGARGDATPWAHICTGGFSNSPHLVAVRIRRRWRGRRRNLEPSAREVFWGPMAYAIGMTGALLDRLTHHVHCVACAAKLEVTLRDRTELPWPILANLIMFLGLSSRFLATTVPKDRHQL